MLNETDVRQVIGTTAYSPEGEKIGKVSQLFLDDETGQPEFVTVNTGLLGTSESFVPVDEATLEGDRLRLPYPKDKVKEAPSVDVDAGHMSEEEESRLFEYYGRGYPASDEAGRPGPGVEGRDLSGPETDEAMTRSEEHLRVGTTSQEAGRVRLRKYVTTETETRTVPVRKERAVLETEPITDANLDQATAGPPISDEEHEVVLHEERPVTETAAEPVERVRLRTEATVEEENVSGKVRKEHVETEGDVDGR